MEIVITNNQPTTKGGDVVVRTTAFRADAVLAQRHVTYFMSSEEREAYWAEHRAREEDEAWRLVTIPEPTPSDIREDVKAAWDEYDSPEPGLHWGCGCDHDELEDEEDEFTPSEERRLELLLEYIERVELAGETLYAERLRYALQLDQWSKEVAQWPAPVAEFPRSRRSATPAQQRRDGSVKLRSSRRNRPSGEEQNRMYGDWSNPGTQHHIGDDRCNGVDHRHDLLATSDWAIADSDDGTAAEELTATQMDDLYGIGPNEELVVSDEAEAAWQALDQFLYEVEERRQPAAPQPTRSWEDTDRIMVPSSRRTITAYGTPNGEGWYKITRPQLPKHLRCPEDEPRRNGRPRVSSGEPRGLRRPAIA